MGELYQLGFPNGKRYIGVTNTTAKERFKGHVYAAKRGEGLKISRAIRKYEGSAVEVRTLVVAHDRGYLLDLERRAIAAYDTRRNGYNMTDGGDGASLGSAHHLGFKHTEATKAVMSAKKLGKKLNLTGEARKARAEASRGNTWSAGVVQSEATKIKRVKAILSQQETQEVKAKSGYRGVHWCPTSRRWRAMYSRKTLGRYDTALEAKAVRDAYVKEVLK